MLLIFLLFIVSPFLCLDRPDLSREIMSDSGDQHGTWRTLVYCPNDQYIKGFNQKTYCSSAGLNIMEMYCSPIDHSSSATIVSQDDPNGSWQTAQNCSPEDFLHAYYVSKSGSAALLNDLSVSDIRMKCISESIYRDAGGGCSSDWSQPAICQPGEAMCGYQLRFSDPAGFGYDDLGTTNTLFKCCLICKKLDGWFLNSGPLCSLCDSYCNTCEGSSSSCLSCYSSDTLSGTTCSRAVNYFEAENILNAVSFDDASINSLNIVTSNKVGTLVTNCLGMSWLGGYGVLGSGDWVKVEIKNKPPHYKVRIKIRILKGDFWNGNDAQIYIDDILQSIPSLQGIQQLSGILYFGSQCGGSEPEDVINVDYAIGHKLMPFSIKISSNLDGNAYTKSWGIRNVIIGLYTCHFSCLTCSGSLNTQCLTCYPNGMKIAGLCVCKNTFYTVENSACTTEVCTECIPCPVGCDICESAAPHLCSQCIAGYFLKSDTTSCPSPYWGDVDSNTCVVSCPNANQFGDTADSRKCNVCDFTCATCLTTALTCTSCSGIYYKSGASCYETCPTPNYAVVGTNQCETNCPANNYKHDVDRICYSTCPSLFFANKLTGKCTNPCPDGMYPNSLTTTCEICHNTCYTCNGPLDTDCILCYSHADKVNGKCQCDSTYYAVPDNSCTTPQNCLVCQGCSTGCATCTGISSTECSSCITNYFLTQSNSCVTDCPIKDPAPGYWGDSTTNTCVATCPDSNQYGDSSDHRKCKTCDSTCTTCSGTSLTCISCSGTRFLSGSTCYTQCPSPYYASNTNNLCKADCPDSQFKYDVDRTCQTSCPNPYYGNPQTKMCEDPCPSEMYKSTATQRCDLCDFNCQTCSGSAISCDSCKYGWVKSGTSCTMPTNIYLLDSQLSAAFSSHNFMVTNADLTNNHISYCGSYHIVGGVNDFGQNAYVSKSYTNVVAHYKIRITFYVLKIDTWDSKTVSVYMNTSPALLIDSKLFTINQDTSITQTCGTANIPEALRQFDIYKDHFTSNIDIKISTDLAVSSSVGSWGIYEFKLYVDRCHGTCLTCTGLLSTQCDTCYSDATKNANNECPCNTHFYPVTTPAESCTTPPCTICTSCHSECNNCDAGSNTYCLDCISPRYFYTKQCYLICPEPLWGITATRKCESQCTTVHEYADVSDRICKPCHSECDKCSGPSNVECLACITPYFLQTKDGLSKCVENCEEGLIPVADLRICKLCDASCESCDGVTANNCLTCVFPKYLLNKKCLGVCPDNYYGNNATQICVKLCPEKTFGANGANNCWPCSIECKKCIGLSANECIGCESNYYLQKTSCLKECEQGFYFLENSLKCYECMQDCIVCLNNAVCEKCAIGKYLLMPDRKECVSCDNDGFYVDQNKCFACTKNCKICDSINTCVECSTGFYYKLGGCHMQVVVLANLNYDNYTPNRFHLTLNKEWDTASQIIISSPLLTIEGFSNQDFSYSIKTNANISTEIILDISLKTKASLSQKLLIKFDNLPRKEEFILANNELFIFLNKSSNCPEQTIYDSLNNSCRNVTIVTASLDYTQLSNELSLSFDRKFPSFWEVLPNNTEVSIENLDYSYEITLKNSDTYIIHLQFNNSFANKPLCSVSLNVPDYVIFNANNSLQLKSQVLSINLKDYYFLSAQTQEIIQTTKEMTKNMNGITGATTVTNNFLAFGSSFAITSMMSVESIRFLKFLDIDYPPNVDSMFQSSSPIPGIVPNINIEIDPGDKMMLPFVFSKNDISIYLFNNNGNIVIENMTYLIFSYFILILNAFFQRTNYKYAKKAITFLAAIFVWNFVTSYFLGVFLNYIFYDLLFLKFPAMETPSGILNYVLALAELIVIIFIFLFLAFKVFQMHKISNPSPNKVMPISAILEKAPHQSALNTESPLDEKDNYDNKKEVNLFKSRNHDFSSVFPKEIEISSNLPKSLNLLQNFESDELQIESKMKKHDKLEVDSILKSEERIFENELLEDSSKTKAFEQITEISNISSDKKNINKTHKSPIFLASPWTDIDKLLKPSIYGRRTLDKINPFDEEDKKSSLYRRLNSLKRASLSWNSVDKSNPKKLQKHELNKDLRFSCLYDDFEHSNVGQSLYIILNILRQIVIAITVVLFYNYPLFAISLINFVNFQMIAFLLFIRPLKNRVDFMQNCVNEICMNVASWCSFFLALLQIFDKGSNDDKINIGWGIIIANGIIMFAVILRFFLTILEMLWLIYKFLVKFRYKKK